MGNLEALTATVKVIEGCECPATVRWFNCYCPNAEAWDYKVLPLNDEDCLDYPSPEALADLMTKHGLEASYVYMDTKICGGGFDGETLMGAAKKVLEKRQSA